jgi:hypothetical protein
MASAWGMNSSNRFSSMAFFRNRTAELLAVGPKTMRMVSKNEGAA